MRYLDDESGPPVLLLGVAAVTGAVPALLTFTYPSVATWLMSVAVFVSAVAAFRMLRVESLRLLVVAFGYLPALAAMFAWVDVVSK